MKEVKCIYAVLKLQNNGVLILWDGPTLPFKTAQEVLKLRQTQHPEDKFFIYKEGQE